MLKALPSKTHMALVELQKRNLLKFIISQNVDGLHRRSGIPSDKIAELHGNTNLEQCKKCGKKYLRDFRTRNAMAVHDHATGRFCDDKKCNGELFDSIINFGEGLPELDMNLGFAHSAEADLCLVMGSSLRVSPACNMPELVGKNKKNLVIVNL
jgi:NAD-dependent SIR2 family protein deacetylase